MDGNQEPEVVPAGHGDAGLGRAGGRAAAAVAGRLGAGPGAMDTAAADSAGIINRIRELEDWKSAASAEQARLAVAFDLLQRREQARLGIPAEKLGAGIGAQIALARRESPPRAAGSWAWPKPSSPKCPTPSPPSKPGSSTNGAPPSSSGKPPA